MLESEVQASLSPLTQAPAHRLHPGSLRADAAAVIAVTTLSVLLAARFQLSETLYQLSRHWEYVQLDEWPVGLLALAIGLVWLSWRRNRQAVRELQARRATQARLAGVLTENRKLARESLRIQELERKHLARELHDELGQYLNAIKLDAVAIGDIADAEPGSVGNAAREIIHTVDHMYGAVRNMIRRLRPVGLDELGLAAAVEDCVDHWRQRLPTTKFSLTLLGDFDRLDESLTLTLYRLIQEGLTNVYKHAQARQVSIVLQRRLSARSGADDADGLMLSMSDDGQGMDTSAPKHGFGLHGMRERVETAGGTFSLPSQPGRGLAFEARLPARTPS